MDNDTEELEVESESDSENEIPLTAKQVIERMEQAWLNEKFAPEILPHKYEIVECLLGQIAYMEENVLQLNTTDFQKALHQMEINRLRFMMSSYLRNRLEKIETYVFAILKNEDTRIEKNEPTYLTVAEMEFAKEYKTSIEQLFNDLLQFWPNRPQSDDWRNSIIPNMNKFVFAKSNAEIEGVMIYSGNNDGEQDYLDLKDQSQMIISYNSIANLVKNGQVELI